MANQLPSDQGAHSVYGQIELQSYSFKSNVMARRDNLGFHIPEIFHQLVLTGKNLHGHEFTMIDIRFREVKHIVTNPAGSADTIIMDIPKTDYEFFKILLSQTLDSKESTAKKLIVEYYSSPNKYEYNATFLIR